MHMVCEHVYMNISPPIIELATALLAIFAASLLRRFSEMMLETMKIYLYV